ncbi:tetratricopeptide repeat protein [Microbacteriaceae bacterium K1510]|nr:tetratricopeptide repeat protein [Microbacteriaceae bacterium K1510]
MNDRGAFGRPYSSQLDASHLGRNGQRHYSLSMRTRFLAPLLAAALVAGVSAAPVKAAPDDMVGPPAKLPQAPKGDRLRNLDFLFGALKAAPNEESAKAVEERIWAVWMVSPSDTTNLLMSRVRAAVEQKDLDLAVKLLDGIIAIKPDYVEAWNRRATINYMRKDYGRALSDIREVLRREPRHFGALSGLGLILQDVGDDKHALEAYRRAIEVYPRLQRIPELVKELQQKVEGRDI